MIRQSWLLSNSLHPEFFRWKGNLNRGWRFENASNPTYSSRRPRLNLQTIKAILKKWRKNGSSDWSVSWVINWELIGGIIRLPVFPFLSSQGSALDVLRGRQANFRKRNVWRSKLASISRLWLLTIWTSILGWLSLNDEVFSHLRGPGTGTSR